MGCLMDRFPSVHPGFSPKSTSASISAVPYKLGWRTHDTVHVVCRRLKIHAIVRRLTRGEGRAFDGTDPAMKDNSRGR